MKMSPKKPSQKFFVHEKALCESPHVGEGTRVWGFSHVMAEARIGSRCNIGEHVFIENKVIIGDGCTIKNGVAIWDSVTLENDVFIGPYAVFTNDLIPRAFLKRGSGSYAPTLVKTGATIGANATLVCGVTIGEYAMVAAGAVVTKDVPSHLLVMGNPAGVAWRVCYCGGRLDNSDYCPACKKSLNKNSVALTIQKILRSTSPDI